MRSFEFDLTSASKSRVSFNRPSSNSLWDKSKNHFVSGSWRYQKYNKHILIQYNTIQYNTIQYNTIQYDTIQYNIIQDIAARFYFTWIGNKKLYCCCVSTTWTLPCVNWRPSNKHLIKSIICQFLENCALKVRNYKPLFQGLGTDHCQIAC